MSNPTAETGNEGLNGGLQSISCRNLQPLRCHPCACKLFRISFPLLITQRSVVQIHPPQPTLSNLPFNSLSAI